MTTAQTPQHEGPATPAAPGSLAARQREAVAALVELRRTRQTKATDLDTTLSSAIQAAESAFTASINRAGEDLQTGKDTVAHNRSTLLKNTEAAFEEQSAQASGAHSKARDEAIERLDSEQRMAEEKLRDAAWLAEASFEGGSEQPRLELERVKGIVREEFSKLTSIEAHARRLAGPRVPMPPCEPDPAAIPPPKQPVSQDTPALDSLIKEREQANTEFKRLSGLTLHAFVRSGGLIVFIILAFAGAGVYHGLTTGLAQPLLTVAFAAAAGVAMLLVALPVRMLALAGTRRRVGPLANSLRNARASGLTALRNADSYKKQIESAITQRKQAEVDAGQQRYQNRLSNVKVRREQILARLDRKHSVLATENAKRLTVKLADIETKADAKLQELESAHAAAIAQADETHKQTITDTNHAHKNAHAELNAAWHACVEHAQSCVDESIAEMNAACPEWSHPAWPAHSVNAASPAIRVGSFSIGALEGDRDSTVIDPPALLDTPTHASLIVRTGPDGRDDALDTLRNTVLRALTALPAGKVRLTMIDPVGLGQSFAGFMRLADHDERLVDSKIWTEPRHIEQRLADLTGHMETVIQKYLRNEFESIEAYNQKAGEIAEPYRFLVIADFPTGFSEQAARRLTSIIESGPRCGVFVLVHHDPRGKLPETITKGDLDAGCSVIERRDNTFIWNDTAYDSLPLTLEPPPSDTQTAEILDAVGKAALESGKVEVPFRTLAPPDDSQMWSLNCSSQLSIPLGRAGATKLQRLKLGKGTSQHILIAGKTGSGKSTLLHVMITAGALWYSPDELEFYLVDFKKGVEFSAYCGGMLPHARAIAIESDREFGLSVLHRLDEELKRRGDMFRDLGVQTIGAARDALIAAGRTETIPRTMLVIDEFQEFFTEDDKIAQDAGLLLDRLVRQGRAFGMHVFLGSQTLSGAYSLARSTVGQMAIRIALQCSETDSYLILSEDNAAARLLNRPGEAIYNDANGMIEGNNPFQVCWLPDAERDAMLEKVRTRTAQTPPTIDTHTIVFEGNVPADLADNQPLASALLPGAVPVRAARAWIGEPVAIKPPTGAHLRRQAGSNLLVLGQQDETSRAMLASALVGLAGQHAADPAGVKIAFLDSTPPDDAEADAVDDIVRTLDDAGPLKVSFGRVRQAGGLLAEFEAERLRREEDDSAAHKPWYLFILGLQRFRDLRQKEDDFSFSLSDGDDDDDAGGSPAEHLANLLRDGSALGLHIIAWCDTSASLSRTLDRRGIGQFEQRAVLQMSSSDSSNIIDTPAAGKLGMNRGLLFNEELGTLDKFRPYRMPSQDLVSKVAVSLGGSASG